MTQETLNRAGSYFKRYSRLSCSPCRGRTRKPWTDFERPSTQIRTIMVYLARRSIELLTGRSQVPKGEMVVWT
jgi:hypothetical protein